MVVQRTVKLIKPNYPKKQVVPAVLTIAGSDSSGGAGIEADLKTITAHQVYGLTCITALTAQNTQLVQAIEKTPEDHLRKILTSNFDDFVYGYEKDDDGSIPLKTIKTGMLTKSAIVVLQEFFPLLQKHDVKFVVDPVMISTSGTELFDKEAMDICVDTLIKHAYLVTPNFVEAVALLKCKTKNPGFKEPHIESIQDFVQFVVDLQKALGCENILVKGGHIPWNKKTNKPFQGNVQQHQDDILVVDILYQSATDSVTVYESEFIFTKDTHGTGCTLSASIASNIAKGLSLEQALPLSINYIHKGILSLEKKLGHGNGPLNHTVSPESSSSSIVSPVDSDISTEIAQKFDSFYDFFKTHPKIKHNWKNYTQHEFVHQISTNKLRFNRFLYFLKQDFYYLVNYAQIHALSAAVAPTYQQTHSEATIIGNIVKEIERHKSKLQLKYNIDYDKADLDIELQPGKACLDYCSFLLDVGRREDFLGIKVAVAPCLHGYAEAGKFAAKLRAQYKAGADDEVSCTQEESDTYDSWIADYNSDWYLEAHEDGIKSLQALLKTNPITKERLDDLVDIFNRATILENNFWSEVIND